MSFLDLILTGWAEIRAHKMRSFLSFFAVAIGIATFFYTLSILSQSYDRLDDIAKISGKGRLETEVNHPLNMQQYEMLSKALTAGASLSLETGSFWGSPVYKGIPFSNISTYGVLPSFKDADFVYRLEGRFINWNDVQNKNNVAVMTVLPYEKETIQSSMRNRDRYNEDGIPTVDAYTFSLHHNLLHQHIKINDIDFTIVGLLHVPERERDTRLIGHEYWTDHEMPRLLVPYTTWYNLIPSWWLSNSSLNTKIRIVTGSERAAAPAAAKLNSFLRQEFGADAKPDISFFDKKLKSESKQARRELYNMFFMGLIAMIAGGIGIMNVTMAVIFARTKEIGIRRALGASKRTILAQFLTEAVLLGFCGSVAGMILGYLALLHLARNTSQMTFSWWVVAISVLIGLVTSFVFALYPAWQAAKLKPVDALKYE